MRPNHRVGISRYIAPHSSSGWYVKTLALFALLAGVLLGGGSWLYHQQMIRKLGLTRLAADPAALEQNGLNMLIFSMTISAIAMTCYFLLVGAFFFHRVAGPVYRLKRHMLDILDDKPVARLTLREQDQLQDLAEVYNALLVKLEVIGPGSPRHPEL